MSPMQNPTTQFYDRIARYILCVSAQTSLTKDDPNLLGPSKHPYPMLIARYALSCDPPNTRGQLDAIHEAFNVHAH